jgi:hypothetical protein
MMRELELREINIWSVVKVSFFLFIVIGLCMGGMCFLALSTLGGLFGAMLGPTAGSVMGSAFPAMFGFLMVFFIAVFYTVMGTLMAFLLSFFYNVVARLCGGITVTVQERDPLSGSILYVTDKAAEHGPGEVRA